MKIIEVYGLALNISEHEKWLAIDDNGAVWGFEYKPTKSSEVWVMDEDEDDNFSTDKFIDRTEPYHEFNYNVLEWENSLINVEKHGYEHLPNLEKL